MTTLGVGRGVHREGGRPGPSTSMEAQLSSGDTVLASRSLPPMVRAAIDTLIEEYARLEQTRSNWLLQEATMKAKIEAMERERAAESQVRATLSARIGMLEYALQQRQQRDTSDDSKASGKSVQFQVPPKLQRGAVSSPGINVPDENVEPVPVIRSTGSDKYKTLPSNFMSRSAKSMSPGRRMLWKYLEELGYVPDPSANKPTSGIDGQPESAPAPTVSVASVAPDVPEPVVTKPVSRNHSRKETDESVGGASDLQGDLVEDDDVGAPDATDLDETIRSPPILPKIAPVLAHPESVTDAQYSFEWTCTAPQDMSWKPKLTLLHHLDGVRSVCFHDREPVLLTGSEDGTTKLWNIDAERGARRIQPVHTYRGHSCMVTSVAIQQSTCVTASIDGALIVWDLPDLERGDPYDTHGSANKFRCVPGGLCAPFR